MRRSKKRQLRKVRRALWHVHHVELVLGNIAAHKVFDRMIKRMNKEIARAFRTGMQGFVGMPKYNDRDG